MTKQKRYVVIGGSAAGPKAAARIRRLDQEAEICIVQKDPDLSMASCGYPYYIAGCFDDRNALLCTPTGVIRDPTFFQNAKNIRAYIRTEATHIDRTNQTVTCKDLATGNEFYLAYDKLILATGALPKIPSLPGTDLSGVTALHSMQDVDFLRGIRDAQKVKKAVVIGAGLIGIETCEALQQSGIEVTVVEMLPQILMFLDWQLAKILENHVGSKTSGIITEKTVSAFLGSGGKLEEVLLDDGAKLPCQLAVAATGVRPNSILAKQAGLKIGEYGGIWVDKYLQTSDPNIYAAGDCVVIPNLVTGYPVHAPYGDLANLQGRVAGENAATCNQSVFPGTLQTGICKVFDFSAGSTGATEKSARLSGAKEDVVSVVIAGPDKPFFMNGKLLLTKLIANRRNGKILGMQCIGPGDVSKQVSQAALSIRGGMTVTDLATADLPYAPSYALPIDNFIVAAHVLQNKIEGRFTGISAIDVKQKIDQGEKPFLLDTRGPDEYEIMRLGIGETLIPLGALRSRINELPKEKDREIICFCKISLRGYEAALYLQSQGYKNVKVMEGGLMAWPYKREK